VAAERRGAVLWFTGLSGAGKTTIARAVYEALSARGVAVEPLDGDVLRAMFPNTGFSREERDAHVRRIGFVASRLEHHGVVVIAALISPFAASRAFVRGLCRNFIEIYVATPLEECERRDTKHLYAKARRGEIGDFTGITSPYEPPEHPELIIQTTGCTVDEAVAKVLETLDARP
jgi:adenylylsulfate kinase